MPDLYHSLLGYDLGHLQIVAGLWGIEIKSNHADQASKELSAALLDPGLTAEVIHSLPSEALSALRSLTEAGGRIPWASFSRQYGEVREMGAGKRDRERPYLKPVSPAEILYYRALLARAFFATQRGPQEFAFIPEDVLEVLKQVTLRAGKGKIRANPFGPPGHAASPAEKARLLPADDQILEEATTLLAGLRLGRKAIPDPKMISLLEAAGLLKKGLPQAEKVKTFLEAPRQDALHALIQAWQASETFNELRLIPGLILEGKWSNPALATRRLLLNLLGTIPAGQWWSLAAFVKGIKDKQPDFQRPAGDYDSWFIKRASDGQYLRGFANWDEVDGALIRFFITGILHWLGLADLAAAQEGGAAAAFRITELGLQANGPGRRNANRDSRFPTVEDGKLHVSSQGRIIAPRLTARTVRYQIARFCEWDAEKPGEYHYHLTPASLARAKDQGLKVDHLLALLANHSDAGIPPALVEALKRWEANGAEARAETQIVLRVRTPEILEKLRRSRAARFLGEPLGPTTVVVKGGAIQKVMEAMTEAGLLVEDKTGASSPEGSS